LSEIEPMIKEGAVSGGMIPKLRSAGDALTVCNKVHILDGRRPHSLLLELFTDHGIGTQIVR
jgi:acetylglutamate kinase